MSDEKKEQQGFKVSDRRKRFEDEAPPESRAPEPPPPEAPPAAGDEREPGSGGAAGPEGQIPPDFAHLISRLAQEALFFLGEMPDPTTGKAERNLGAATWTIDTLDMLRAKTKGNLSEEEAQMLEAYLAELRVRFLRASGFLGEPAR
jgi:hypothetical protein